MHDAKKKKKIRETDRQSHVDTFSGAPGVSKRSVAG